MGESTPIKWRERVADGEEARFDALAQKLVGAGKHAARTLHVKPLASFHAELEVVAVPAPLRHGLFAKPLRYPAFVRFSSGAPRAQDDRVPEVRGLAVKVVGVEGPKIIAGLEGAKTQDFLAILTPTFPFKDPAAFVDVAGSRSLLAVVAAIVKHFGLVRGLGMLGALRKDLDGAATSVAERTYFTALPIALGPEAIKVRFRPVALPPPLLEPSGSERLAVVVQARCRKATLTFELEAQAFVDEARTPIEDPTVPWPEEIAPWTKLARLTIPQQDTTSEAGLRLASYIDRLSFDPWHALPAHRPLGAVMRARAAAYKYASIARDAVIETAVQTPGAILRPSA